MLLALVTALRGARVGVVLDRETAVVRSLWRSRTIPRRAVTHVEPDGPFAPTIERNEAHVGNARPEPDAAILRFAARRTCDGRGAPINKWEDVLNAITGPLFSRADE